MAAELRCHRDASHGASLDRAAPIPGSSPTEFTPNHPVSLGQEFRAPYFEGWDGKGADLQRKSKAVSACTILREIQYYIVKY